MDRGDEHNNVWKASARERLRLFSSTRTRFNTSWYFAIILLTWVLSTQISDAYPLWQKLVIGLLGALFFFISMALAQTITDLLMVFQGLPLRNVMLFVFGGQTAVPGDLTRPSLEVFTAGAQLLVTVVMAALFNWVYAARANSEGALPTVLQLLSFVWYMTAAINLLPAYPLAGGRAVTAAIWKLTGKRLTGVRVTSALGQLFGLAMLGGGLWLLFGQREATGGLMLAFLGWALQSAARISVGRVAVLDALLDARIGNVMSREFRAVAPGLTLDELVREHVLISGQDYVPVEDGGQLVGAVTARRVGRVRRKRWRTTPVTKVMIPARRMARVKTDESAAHGYDRMEQHRAATLPVLTEDGRLAGIITRDRLMRLARARQVLRV